MNLGQGFPDWESPAFLKEAGKRAVDEDHNQYTRSAGHPALVQELSKWYSRVLQRDVDAMSEVRPPQHCTPLERLGSEALHRSQ